MKTEITDINGREITVITADEGKTFVRKHDGAQMGEQISLGIDYSTGSPRQDMAEYYEETDKPKEEEDMEE